MTTDSSPSQIDKQARLAYQDGDYRQAALLFQTAAERLLASGNELAAAEMRNNQSVALLRAGDAATALQAVLGTEEIFAQAGEPRLTAMALGNQAAAREAIGQLPQALVLYQQTAEMLAQTGDQELRGVVLQSLSALQLRMGKQFEAMASMQSALNTRKRLSLKERFLNQLLKIPFRMLR